MIRGLLELSTGLITGSDVKPDRKLSKELLAAGYRGEGIVGRSWIVKTHFPERAGWKSFEASKVIVLVRNPFDAIDSYFNMILTRTHTCSIAESEYVRLRSYWENHVLKEMPMWYRFHRYWLEKKKEGYPILIVRYERLLRRRDDEFNRVLRFICGSDDVFMTSCLERLKRAKMRTSSRTKVAAAQKRQDSSEETTSNEIKSCERSSALPPDTISATSSSCKTTNDDVLVVQKSGQGSYVPRSGGIGKSLRHYAQDLKGRVLSQNPALRSLLEYFGYAQLLEDGDENGLSTIPAYLAPLAPIFSTDDEKLKDPVAPAVTAESERAAPSTTAATKCMRINEKSSLLRVATDSDPFARGVRWARPLHKSGIEYASKR
eukprot:g1527.t1